MEAGAMGLLIIISSAKTADCRDAVSINRVIGLNVALDSRSDCSFSTLAFGGVRA